MQPELNEYSQEIPLTQNTQDSHQDSQYGFDAPDLQSSPRPCTEGAGRRFLRRSASNAGLLSSSGGSDEGSERPLRRLSPPSRPHTRSPVDRIAEHERALPYMQKKKNQGPSFTVIQGGKKSGTCQFGIADFPNGSSPVRINSPFANSCRGLDPHPVSPSSCFVVRCFPCVKAFPPVSHDASRVENCLFALLSGRRSLERIGTRLGDFRPGRYPSCGKASLYSTYSSCVMA